MKAFQGSVRQVFTAPVLSGASLPASIAIENINSLLSKITLPNEMGIETKLSPSQIQRLTALTWRDGSPVLALNNRVIIYEVIGNIREAMKREQDARRASSHSVAAPSAFDSVVNTLSDFKDLERGNPKLIFETPLFVKEQNQYYGDLERARRAVKIITGIYKCIRCFSTNTTTVEMQARSADEPMTVKTTCFACGKVWI